MPDPKHYKNLLLTRLNLLDSRLHGIEEELDLTPNPDDEERAVERESDEVLEQLGNAGLLEIDLIKMALKRIEDGVFGICTKCEEDISEARLAAVPHAAMCRNCA